MKNFIKKISTTIVTISLLLSCFAFTSHAASTAISLSSNSLNPGQDLTVTVSFNGGEAMYGTEFTVSYNQAVLRFDSGDSANGGAGNIKVVGTPAGASKASYSLHFTAIATGSSSISVSNCTYVGNDETPATGSAVNISVVDVAKSDNANLSSLKLSYGNLSPKFSSSRTTYKATVPNNVTSCKVFATAEDPAATVSIQGSEQLAVGDTMQTITVTAQSGATKSYSVTITRLAEGETTGSEQTSSVEHEEPTDTPDATDSTVLVNGITYNIMTDLSSVTLFKGFSPATTTYRGVEYPVAVNEKGDMTIFYLMPVDSTNPSLFTYDQDSGKFSEMKYMIVGDTPYIFTDKDITSNAPVGYYTTTTTINGFSLKCFGYSSTDMKEFLIIECYRDGKYGFFRYDTIENVIQRAPDFDITDIAKTTSISDKNIIERFKALSTNSKIIVVSIIVAIIAVIAIVVLLLIKFIRKKKSQFDFDNTIGFDDVNVSDAFEAKKTKKRIPDDDDEE